MSKIAAKLRKNSTLQEIILWSRLKNRKFHNLKFRRQYALGKYIVDFLCLEKRIIIELDGWQHKEKKQERYDKERSKFLEGLSYKILRFWNNEINDNLNGVLLKIEENIDLVSPHPPRGGAPSPTGRRGLKISPHPASPTGRGGIKEIVN